MHSILHLLEEGVAVWRRQRWQVESCRSTGCAVGDDIHVLTTRQRHVRRPAGASAKVERYRLAVDDEADRHVRGCRCSLER
jgi:hypothetical protein